MGTETIMSTIEQLIVEQLTAQPTSIVHLAGLVDKGR